MTAYHSHEPNYSMKQTLVPLRGAINSAYVTSRNGDLPVDDTLH
jgi:hypothetical protein